MEPRSEEKKSRFRIEKLEERIAPARFVPGSKGGGTGQEHGALHSEGAGNSAHGHAHADADGLGHEGAPPGEHRPNLKEA